MNTAEQGPETGNRLQQLGEYIGERLQLVKAFFTDESLEMPSWTQDQTPKDN